MQTNISSNQAIAVADAGKDSAQFKKSPEASAGSALADRIEKLTKILRGVGSLVLVASAATFLLQRWSAGNDIQRYFALLALTVVLSGAGFLCGLGIKETKGARTFLGLSLAVVPIHFAVLGGLIYSRFALDATHGWIPNYALWAAPSANAAVVTALAALFVLVPLSYVSYLSLARSRAKLLTAAYLAANACLLLPVRNPNVIGPLVAAMAALLTKVELGALGKDTGLRTFEGRLVRLLMAVPALIMIARGIQSYEITEMFLGSTLACVSFLLFAFAPNATDKRAAQNFMQGFSAIPAGLAWFFIAKCLTASFLPSMSLLLPMFALPYAGILIAMSVWSVDPGAGYRRFAAVVAMTGAAANLLLFPGVFSSFLCLASAIGVLAYGYAVEQRIIFTSGAMGILFGLTYHLRYALSLYSLNRWGSLAAVGIATIIGASLLEQNRDRLIAGVSNFRTKLKKWEY